MNLRSPLRGHLLPPLYNVGQLPICPASSWGLLHTWEAAGKCLDLDTRPCRPLPTQLPPSPEMSSTSREVLPCLWAAGGMKDLSAETLSILTEEA